MNTHQSLPLRRWKRNQQSDAAIPDHITDDEPEPPATKEPPGRGRRAASTTKGRKQTNLLHPASTAQDSPSQRTNRLQRRTPVETLRTPSTPPSEENKTTLTLDDARRDNAGRYKLDEANLQLNKLLSPRSRTPLLASLPRGTLKEREPVDRREKHESPAESPKPTVARGKTGFPLHSFHFKCYSKNVSGCPYSQ
jgi:hypothetical protein